MPSHKTPAKPRFFLALPGLVGLALLGVVAGCATPVSSNATGNIYSDAGTFFSADVPLTDGVAADGGGAADTGADSAAVDVGSADVTACVSTCNEGEKRCDPGAGGTQSCVDTNDTGCFSWSTPTPCGKSQACDKGACVTQCPSSACTVTGTKKCGASDDVLECGDFDADGCNEWGKSAPCGNGKVCTQGFCASTCVSSCTTTGAKKCDGNSVVACGDHDGNGCLSWGTPATCGAKVCSNGACEDSCKSECTTSGAKTCDGNGYKECKDYNKDGCLTWGTVVNCAQAETCSSGACLTQCKNECTAVGAKKCDLDKIVTCGDFNKDGCLAWGTPIGCAKPLVCQGGFCATSCKDGCTVKGAKQCDVGGGVSACDDYNKDGCLEWGTPVACGAGTVCSNGLCALSCSNSCKTKGDVQCVPGSTTKKQTCDDYNKDGCLAWGTATDCGTTLVCSAGKCASSCTSTCTNKGEKKCDGNSVKTCGDYNADGCTEWGTPVACESYELCVGSICKQKPSPSKVLINELVYDSVGKDDATFVELKGPAGADLTGYTLVGVNGNGGLLYNVITLTGKIGSDGLFVVGHTAAPKDIADQSDQKSSSVDFQNGPDSVQLRYGGTVVDAVGYGVFSGLTFGGEGSPVPSVAAGSSLGRDASSTDTDDNLKDFKAFVSPTPGAANSAANKPPVAKLACPGGGAPNTMLQFDASASYDTEGKIDQYTFDFGDGTAAVKSATPKVNHTFAKAGTFTVKLSVIDDGGATATASCVVGVSAGNQPPTAKLVCPGSVSLNQTFSVDASGSSDNDGLLAKYTFDMGDGTAQKAGASAKASHAYAKAGSFAVSVTVMDDKSATAKATCTILATAGTPPTVNIIKPFDGKQVTQGDVVPVIVDATPPAGKSIAKVEFFIDGKSVGSDTTAPYETKWTVPATAKTGSKVLLTAIATDSAGTPGTSKPVALLIANDKPKLSFTAVVSGKLKVVLDANGVSDTESVKSKLQVRVDWENDGKWDTAWATDKVYEHTYAKEGKFVINVAVRDEAGQETVGSKSITLSSTLTVSGAIQTTTWTGTVVVTGDLSVASGQTLTIAPGTSVLFAPIDQDKDGVGDFDLVVNGVLNVKGTKDEPVVFTVYGVDKKAGKGWNRVKLMGAGSTITYAVFEYAQTGLEVRAKATVTHTLFQQNQTGVHANQGSQLTLTAVTGKDNLNHGLYVTGGGQSASSGSVWSNNGDSGVKVTNTSTTATVLNMTGDSVELNKLAGVEVEGYATGLVTKSTISNNSYEGLRLYAYSTYDPQVAFRLNNITENAQVGARLAKTVNLSVATSAKDYLTKNSAVWSTPAGGAIDSILMSYSESDYYSQNYIKGYVKSGSTTLVSVSSTVSKRWQTLGNKSATSIFASISDTSGSSYSGSMTIYAVSWIKKGAIREASVLMYSKTVDLRHNYWGVFPNVLDVVSLSSPSAVTLDGFVGKYFDATWTRAPYYGGETLTANQSWSGQVWITGDLTVASSSTITVAAGTKISIVRHDQDGDGTGDVAWTTAGVFKTNGTSQLPVMIGPADVTQKPKAWEKLYFHNAAHGVAMMTHTIVEYGTNGIELGDGKHVLDSVTVRNNAVDGMRVTGAGWTAKNFVAKNNGGSGLWLANSSGGIDGGTVEGNQGSGVYMTGSTSTVLKNMNINKNVVAGVTIVDAKPTLSQLNINYNGLGIWTRGSAGGLVTKCNIKYNNNEGVLLFSENAKSPTIVIDGNNIYGNSVKEGGAVASPNLQAATSAKDYLTKGSALWKTPKGETILALRWAYSESDYYSQNYIRGYVRKDGPNGAALLSTSSTLSARWQTLASNANATSVLAQVADTSGSSYSGATTVYSVYYRGSTITTELTAATVAGKVKATNNYWGTFLDVEKKLALARKDGIDFQGFKIGEVNGTGPQ